MSNPAGRLRVCVTCLVAIFAAVAILRNAPRFSSRPDRPRRMPHPSFQVDVIEQDAATPGKIIRATTGQGEQVLSYRCKPDDAAIAVISVRDKSSGIDLIPRILNARDKKGRNYVATLQISGRVSLISLQHGFAKRPESVSVSLTTGPVGPDSPVTDIVFTKISDGHRVVPFPTNVSNAAVATFDDRRGILNIRPTLRLAADEGVEAHLLATSFGEGRRMRDDLPYLSRAFPNYSGRDIDSALVELDRVRYTDSETTLIYRNATVVESEGLRYLQFPIRQQVGAIQNLTASMGTIHHGIGPKILTKSGVQRAQIFIQLDRVNAARSIPVPGDHKGDHPPTLSLIDIKPRPSALGFESINVRLLDASGVGAQNGGFEQTVFGPGPPASKAPSIIPELEVRIRIRKPTVLSMSQIILPVVHTDSPHVTIGLQ